MTGDKESESELGFGPGEQEALTLALLAIAWADREIQEEEKELLPRLLDELGLSGTTRERLERHFSEPVDFDDVPWRTIPAQGRAFVYRAAVQIARADGVVDPRERHAIARLAGLLELPQEFIAQVDAGEEPSPDLIET